MNPTDFIAPDAGRIVRTNDGAAAFVPSPLPPDLPLSWEMLDRISRAERAVAGLRGIGATLPNPHLLIAPFARREAVLSSRIEGTTSSVGDLVAFEAGNVPADSGDVQEVANYVAALDYGLARLKEFPLSLRLIREVHERLMGGVRGGSSSNPGEFRHLQNWIGTSGSKIADAKYVPPPVLEMQTALDAFEKFLHAPSRLPALIRFALIHYHFEAIHPFLDGNGRVGRLLITFLFHTEELLDHPLLYLSGFFERHRDDYYRLLLKVSQRGAWEEWIDYFLRAVAEQANDAVRRARALLDLRQEYRRRTTAARSSALLGAMIDRLFALPGTSIAAAARELNVTYPSAKKNIEKLVAVGILTEPAAGRNRLYLAKEIIDLLEAP